jgi:hypothetical protein
VRLALALSLAVVVALVMADAHVGSIAVWKIALAACGLALIAFAGPRTKD